VERVLQSAHAAAGGGRTCEVEVVSWQEWSVTILQVVRRGIEPVRQQTPPPPPPPTCVLGHCLAQDTGAGHPALAHAVGERLRLGAAEGGGEKVVGVSDASTGRRVRSEIMTARQ
jgi:hypothetical protein